MLAVCMASILCFGIKICIVHVEILLSHERTVESNYMHSTISEVGQG